ncbi:MAG: HNH endonuclease signature motif containing protein, partial [Knoellia sp.]
TDTGASTVSTDAGCGRVMVSRAQATILGPAIVRQHACDADIIPIVLGSDGEILDVGRGVRLFTRGQRRALWHRDGTCTYPGCDMPAGWVQAHHLIHWVDGGPSDLANAALLCQRHHTQVHEQRLIAAVHPPGETGSCVTWDLTPGSYDRELPARLTTIRREQAKKRATGQQRAAERAHLDTGPPDPWMYEPPEHVIWAWVEEWMAEAEALESESAPREAEIDDALATMLDEERANTP